MDHELFFTPVTFTITVKLKFKPISILPVCTLEESLRLLKIAEADELLYQQNDVIFDFLGSNDEVAVTMLTGSIIAEA